MLIIYSTILFLGICFFYLRSKKTAFKKGPILEKFLLKLGNKTSFIGFFFLGISYLNIALLYGVGLSFFIWILLLMLALSLVVILIPLIFITRKEK
jgi:hypothetical protein